jgi:hypothetical protein
LQFGLGTHLLVEVLVEKLTLSHSAASRLSSLALLEILPSSPHPVQQHFPFMTGQRPLLLYLLLIMFTLITLSLITAEGSLGQCLGMSELGIFLIFQLL